MDLPHIIKAILYFLLSVQCFATESKAEIDRWAYLNNGGSVKSLVANKNALYAIADNNTLLVLQRNGLFANVDNNIFDVDVNEDYEVWMTREGKLFAREGVNASNAIGTNWTHVPGNVRQVASGRHGLLLVADNKKDLYYRAGITPDTPTGTQWYKAHLNGVTKVSCGKNTCLAVVGSVLHSTGLLANTNSPRISQWFSIDSAVQDISIYEENSVWKVDTNGTLWENARIVANKDKNITDVSWKKRSNGANYKDVAATEHIQFAVGSDNFIRVLTGCPIFDFEENNLSRWMRKGTAFHNQPVIGDETYYNKTRSGKFDDRLIDTYSQGNHVTGELRSPWFQIRSDMLHFMVGGGSPPENYVALYVDDVEVMLSSGEGTYKTGPNGTFRSSRHWWNVTSYKQKCAYVKVIDNGTGHYTMFDDLRASPPCLKSMESTLMNVGHNGSGSIGQLLEYELYLKGFYTSDNRSLTVNVTYPLEDEIPYIYVEDIWASWAKCELDFDWIFNCRSSPSSSNHCYTLSLTAKNYLLSDVVLTIKLRIYDHHNINVGQTKSINGLIRINFAEEFIRNISHVIDIRRNRNATAKLDLKESFYSNNTFVGDEISYKVNLANEYMNSLQHAYDVIIRLLIPPFMVLVRVEGLENSQGDRQFSPSISQHVVHIPRLLLDDERYIEFALLIDDKPLWRQIYSKKIEGQIIIDEISYCPRKRCKNAFGNGTEISTLLRNKPYPFKLLYKKENNTASLKTYHKLVVNNGSLVTFCGPHNEKAGHCYYGNASVWYKLNPILSDVMYYDSVKREILGVTWSRSKVKMYGPGFRSEVILSDEQWDDAVMSNENLVESTIIRTSIDMQDFSKEVSENGTLWNNWMCCN